MAASMPACIEANRIGPWAMGSAPHKGQADEAASCEGRRIALWEDCSKPARPPQDKAAPRLK